MAASCPTPVGSKRKWCYLKSFVYTRAAWRSAYTRSNQDSVYTRSLPRFCLYQVTSKLLFIPGHFQDSVYTRWCSFTHTSVRGAASAWAADTHLSSDCDSVCVTGFEKSVSWAMTLVGAGWYHQSPRLQAAGLDDVRQQLLAGRLLSRPLCLGVGRVATAGIQLQASLL